MSLGELMSYSSFVICLCSAIYVAFCSDITKAIIGFFIEIAAIGGVLLTLGADYLGLMLFAVSLLGTLLFFSFSSAVRRPKVQKASRPTLIFSVIVAALLSINLGYVFLSGPFLSRTMVDISGSQIPKIGETLLNQQAMVFELLGVLILLVCIGVNLMLRKPGSKQ